MNVDLQIQRINEQMNNGHFNSKPDELYRPIRYILNLGGKRLRPLLTIFGYYLFSGKTEKALIPSLGVEIFHNFTLIHDDIMDRAPLRRGNQTIHKKWNANVAILSGDTMLFKAYDCIIEVDNDIVHQIIKLFNRCTIEVCEGQQWDMNFERRSNVSEDEYIDMIQAKTAVLLGFSLQLGALIGGADKKNQQYLKQCGTNIGVGFQLKDDLLDVFGDSEKFGKKVGGDIIANKKTYLLIKALNLANETQRNTIEYWIDKNDRDEEKIAAITEVYDQIGIKKITENKIKEYFKTGLNYLKKVDCPESRKAELADFTRSLMRRER